MDNILINKRLEKLTEIKGRLKEIDEKLLTISNELNWDLNGLTCEESSDMVTCKINNQHHVPLSKIKLHEEKCAWHQLGYNDYDVPFSEFCESGAAVFLNSEILQLITGNPPLPSGKSSSRSVPQTSANFDQNFTREEKLAIYDYVIANSKQQNSFSELPFQTFSKKEEKKEMTHWEIAAAERDAKRRRASYRNKVHTNRKTHTEILKEVIESQMEVLKEELKTKNTDKDHKKKHSHKHKHSDKDKKYSHLDSQSRKEKEVKDKRKNHHKHSKDREKSTKRSLSDSGSNSSFRSRSRDKHRKWKNDEGRSSQFHKSSKCKRLKL